MPRCFFLRFDGFAVCGDGVKTEIFAIGKVEKTVLPDGKESVGILNFEVVQCQILHVLPAEPDCASTLVALGYYGLRTFPHNDLPVAQIDIFHGVFIEDVEVEVAVGFCANVFHRDITDGSGTALGMFGDLKGAGGI